MFGKVLPELQEHVRTLEAKFIAVKQIKDIKDQIDELKRERVWAEVIESEKVIINWGQFFTSV